MRLAQTLPPASFTSLTDKTGTKLGVEGDFFTLLGSLISVLLAVLGVVLLVFLVIGGFYWMTAGGNEDQVKKAKRMLVNTSVGIVIILFSFAIAQFVQTALVNRLQGTNSSQSDFIDNLENDDCWEDDIYLC